jgi:hypothetical protein
LARQILTVALVAAGHDFSASPIMLPDHLGDRRSLLDRAVASVARWALRGAIRSRSWGLSVIAGSRHWCRHALVSLSNTLVYNQRPSMRDGFSPVALGCTRSLV